MRALQLKTSWCSMNVKDYQSEETLLDGRAVLLRAIRAEDKSALISEFKKLSQRNRYQRFFFAKTTLSDDELAFFTEVDFIKHVALVAAVIVNGQSYPAGVGRFVRDNKDSTTADIAFTVVERYQGLGIASLLLKHLTIIARSLGYHAFTADVMSANETMLEIFRQSNLSMAESTTQGLVQVRLSLL